MPCDRRWDVEDQAARADEPARSWRWPRPGSPLQHDVGLEPDDLAEEVAEAGAPTDPVRQVEGLSYLVHAPKALNS